MNYIETIPMWNLKKKKSNTQKQRIECWEKKAMESRLKGTNFQLCRMSKSGSLVYSPSATVNNITLYTERLLKSRI